MEKITGNEPAMPYTYKEDSALGEIETTYSGLTIRQQFAAMAMQNLVTCCRIDNGQVTGLGSMSKIAVAAADALINELNKQS